MYRADRWAGQSHVVEVWCEKDTLSNIMAPVCHQLHVGFMANRGYSSATAMYDAALRFQTAALAGRQPVVLYLGDHDPSGLDMTRDIRDRLRLMTDVEVVRLALNYDQVEDYDPPPNPTKLQDTRSPGYVEQYGEECWELDALEPAVLDSIIRAAIEEVMDHDLYDEALAREEAD